MRLTFFWCSLLSVVIVGCAPQFKIGTYSGPAGTFTFLEDSTFSYERITIPKQVRSSGIWKIDPDNKSNILIRSTYNTDYMPVVVKESPGQPNTPITLHFDKIFPSESEKDIWMEVIVDAHQVILPSSTTILLADSVRTIPFIQVKYYYNIYRNAGGGSMSEHTKWILCQIYKPLNSGSRVFDISTPQITGDLFSNENFIDFPLQFGKGILIWHRANLIFTPPVYAKSISNK